MKTDPELLFTTDREPIRCYHCEEVIKRTSLYDFYAEEVAEIVVDDDPGTSYPQTNIIHVIVHVNCMTEGDTLA